MPTAMEQRLDRVVHELNEIKNMGFYQRLNEIFDSHKEILIVGGLAAIISSYQPANAAAPTPKTPEAVLYYGGHVNRTSPRQGFSADAQGNPIIVINPQTPTQPSPYIKQEEQNKSPPTQFSSQYISLKQEINGLVQNGASTEVVRRKAEIAKEILNKKELSKIYNGLGNILQEQKNISEALFYYKKSSKSWS